MKTVILFLLALCAITGPVYAQEKVCTEMGCTNGLIIRPEGNMLNDPGHYIFQFFLDEKNMKQVACKGELPLKPCAQGPSFVCSSKLVSIGESSCALPPEQQRIGDIYIYGTPRKVVMAVKKNDEPILGRTLRPS